MRKTLLVTGITGALAIGGATAAIAGTAAHSTAAHSTAAHSTSVRSATVSSAAAISRAHAERIALQQVPGSRVREAELEREHGRLVWEVELLKNRVGYEVEISTGGTVLKVEARADDRGRGRDQRRVRATVPSAEPTEAARRAAATSPAERRTTDRAATVQSGPTSPARTAATTPVTRDDHGLRERHDFNDDHGGQRLGDDRGRDLNDDHGARDLNDDHGHDRGHDQNDDHGARDLNDDHGHDQNDDHGQDR